MSAAEPVRVVRSRHTVPCCGRLERVRMYRAGEDGVAVYANICPVHGPDGKQTPAAAAQRPIGIEAFKAKPLPRRK